MKIFLVSSTLAFFSSTLCAKPAGDQIDLNFFPCPSEGICSIMPLGDSITFGVGSPDLGGYRKFLLEKAWAQGRDIHFVGGEQAGPDTFAGKTFSKSNEGHPGFTIENSSRSGISELVENAINSHRPHIILLMIGTNDVDIQVDLERAPERLGRLLDKIGRSAPESLLVLAKIVPSQNDELNERIKTYNAAMDRLVKERVAQGRHIALVDMYEAFTSRSVQFKTDFLVDKLHPNDAGFAVMSGVWYEAIGHLLR